MNAGHLGTGNQFNSMSSIGNRKSKMSHLTQPQLGTRENTKEQDLERTKLELLNVT